MEVDIVHNTTPTRKIGDILENSTINDFYLGVNYYKNIFRPAKLFTVGFVRPVIGNIPTISELQSHYIAAFLFPNNIQKAPTLNVLEVDRDNLKQLATYPYLDTSRIYPVDMMEYCDRIIGELCWNIPEVSLKNIKIWLCGFATHQYFTDEITNNYPIEMPLAIIILLLIGHIVQLFINCFWKKQSF
tara:strand:- start:474 stop:1034 length:561 start_codon:yes stop_codon:yes gene_type:complete